MNLRRQDLTLVLLGISCWALFAFAVLSSRYLARSAFSGLPRTLEASAFYLAGFLSLICAAVFLRYLVRLGVKLSVALAGLAGSVLLAAFVLLAALKWHTYGTWP